MSWLIFVVIGLQFPSNNADYIIQDLLYYSNQGEQDSEAKQYNKIVESLEWLIFLFDNLNSPRCADYNKRILAVMTSACISPSLRKRSLNDDRLVLDQQQKINSMIHSFFQKSKSKISKSFTKYQAKSSLLCKQLYESLSMHPKQQLYETIKLHDIIFNEIDIVNELVSDFLKKMDSLQEKLKEELFLQKERSQIKKQKVQGDVKITMLRKVSFKREKHALNNRSLSLDTINKKILKCQEQNKEKEAGLGYYFEVQGKKSALPVVSYTKIWFQEKKREYLLCLSKDKGESQFTLMNDKLQALFCFKNSMQNEGQNLKFLQKGELIYLIGKDKIMRINLQIQSDVIVQLFTEKIVRAQLFNDGIVLWVLHDFGQNHYSMLFLNSQMQFYYSIDLKLKVSSIISHFKLSNQEEENIYFLTKSYNETIDVLKLTSSFTITTIYSDLTNIEQVILVKEDRKIEEVIFRQPGNKFYRFTGNAQLKRVKVDIELGETIKQCIVLGEHMYALSSNGKFMLQCQYDPQIIENRQQYVEKNQQSH